MTSLCTAYMLRDFAAVLCVINTGLPSQTILDRTYSAQRFFIFT